MSRIHYWQFLVDEAGIPIEDAEIYAYQAEGNSSADIFSSQTSTTIIHSVPLGHDDYDILTLIKTDSNGYFDFWIEDEWGTVAPYTTSQRFKVAWYKVGTVDAFIDDITVFPTIIHPVDETDTDTTLDKLLSNNLAKSWTDDITTLELSAADHETRIDSLELSAADHETRIDSLESDGTSYGTMATQDADAVNIDGGAIDNTPIGGSTPTSASFTDIIMEGIIIGSHEDITSTSEGVSASVDYETTFVTTDGGSDLNRIGLADGYEGQTKYISCVVEGDAADTWSIRPDNMIGGTKITFTGIGEGCILKMHSAGWVVVGNNGGTIS